MINPSEGIRRFLARLGFAGSIPDEKIQGILDVILSNPALTQREIEILTQRYGFINNTGGTYKEVGSRLGCTGNNVRLLEQNALRKIYNPERHSELSRTRVRLRKLIPTLEYDVLYGPSDLSRKINISNRHVRRVINELCEEFDLSQIKPYLKSDRYFVMRIGEQSLDLPVPSEPSEIQEVQKLLWSFYSEVGYLDEYKRFWKEMESSILSKGFISSSLVNKHSYKGTPRIIAFKDFMRDSMLPVAIHQDYRLGTREPLVVYHPKILREVRSKP